MDNNEQIQDIKKHESQLLQKQIEFDVKMAHFEEKQSHTEELIKNVQTNLLNEMHTSVDGRMDDMSTIIDGQQKTLNKIIEVQGKQTQQIDTIQRTLDQFTKIEDRVLKVEKKQEKLEEKVLAIENNNKTSAELRKEKIRGLWTTIGSMVAAVGAIVCALIAAFA